MTRFTQILLLLFCFTQADAKQWFIATNGTGEPNYVGSISQPFEIVWGMTRAEGRIQAGDTVNIRGGVYNHWQGIPGDLLGTANARCLVRPYQNERVVFRVDASIAFMPLYIYGSYTDYTDLILEVTHTGVTGPTFAEGARFYGPDHAFPGSGHGNRLINCIIRNAINNGVAMQDDDKSEMYGCLIYYSGRRNTGGNAYAIYIQNDTINGAKRTRKIVEDCIILNSFAGYQIHAYGTNVFVDSIFIKGTVVVAQGNADMHPNIMFSSAVGAPTGCRVESTYVYGKYEPVSNGFTRIGLQERKGMADPVFINNYFLQSRLSFRNSTTGRTFSNNVLYGTWPLLTSTTNEVGSNIDTTLIPGNELHIKSGTGRPATKPTGSANKVIIRPNKYKPSRGHMIVLNIDSSASVIIPSTELAKVLNNNDSLYIYDAQNYFGGAVDSGIWTTGSNRTLNIGSHTSIETPVSIPTQNNFSPVTHSDRKFGVYVIQTNGIGGGEPPPPPSPAGPRRRKGGVL